MQQRVLKPTFLSPEQEAKVEAAFYESQDFTRVDWGIVWEVFEKRKDLDPSMWLDVARMWLERLRGDLGGAARVYESVQCLLLSDIPDLAQTAGFCDKAVLATNSILSSLTLDWRPKSLILIFAEEDDFLTYVSHYHPDGESSMPVGILLNDSYAHIAALKTQNGELMRTLVHELAHERVTHLPLPLWVNEGIALGTEQAVFGSAAMEGYANAELIIRSREFWTSESIQEFWAGTSFFAPDERAELSYTLAHILTTLLKDEGKGHYLNFVATSEASDGGQCAAVQSVGFGLGELAARFLGPGSWEPNRAALQRLWGDSE